MMVERFHELDRVEQYLVEWAAWMRESAEVRGYPRSIPGLQSGGASQHFDELCEAVDRRVALATDAAVNDLPPVQVCAIHCAYLAAVWRFRRPLEEILPVAKDGVATGLRKRHIWMGE
jgi:hypothetical protein